MEESSPCSSLPVTLRSSLSLSICPCSSSLCLFPSSCGLPSFFFYMKYISGEAPFSPPKNHVRCGGKSSARSRDAAPRRVELNFQKQRSRSNKIKSHTHTHRERGSAVKSPALSNSTVQSTTMKEEKRVYLCQAVRGVHGYF